jgi:hypothetical protein
MGGPSGAAGLFSLALCSLVACTALVDTRGLVGPPEAVVDAAEAAAPEASTSDASALPSGALVAMWSFEQTSPQIVDVSGSGNHGTSYQVTQVPGKVGMGIELGTTSCVLVPDSPSLRLMDARALTMMAWAKVSACADKARDHGIILNKEDTYELGVKCSGASLMLQEAVMSEPAGWDWYGSAALTRDAWQHIAVTWDGTTVRHYVDGQQKDSHPQGGAIRSATSGLGIGCRDVAADGNPSVAREWFGGVIDEVAIYARVLTDDELRAYYEATR